MLRVLWLLIVGRWPRKALPAKSARCLSGEYCHATPSPLCWDGRCRSHCGTYCGCEQRSPITREEAELIRSVREAQAGRESA